MENRIDISDFTKNALYDSFAKLAVVDVNTGEFLFVKMDPDFQDIDTSGIKSIYSYIQRQVEKGDVSPEYAEGYLRFADPEYVRMRAFSVDRRAVYSFKRKVPEGYRWVTFGVIAPHDCSPEKPAVLFVWRTADSDTTTMVDALKNLSEMYYKILKVNLTKNAYSIIKTAEDPSQLPPTISGWFEMFVANGNIFEEDVSTYRAFVDLPTLREKFRKEPATYSCRYRRKQGEIFRWVQLDLVPSIEYKDDDQVVILYVKDIHEEYLSALRSRDELVEIYNRDALTLLYNRHKYNEDIAELEKCCLRRFSCAYIDVNGLHELNNSLGHQAGDDMLCTVADTLRAAFPDERSYRIGGDEFVVMCRGLSPRSVEHLIAEVRKELIKDGYEIAVGIAGGTDTHFVRRIIGEAELKMREDKETYYKLNKDRHRRKEINDEMEKLLTEKKDEEYLIKLLAKRFAGVYFLNHQRDTIRHIYAPDYFRVMLQKTDYCFSKALRMYINTYVDPDYADKFDDMLDYGDLAKKLRNGGTVQLSYKKVDGLWMHLNILQNENEGDNGSVWIFSDDSSVLSGNKK